MRLTRSQIRYLTTIYKLADHEEGLRSIAVAEALGVTRPSVSRMLNNLVGMELLEKGPSGTIFLTEAGRALAGEHCRELARLGTQLEISLSIPSDVAEKCALLLLSELPQGT